MKNLLLALAILPLGSVSCGDDSGPATGLECGAGTTEMDGACVSDVVCGAGTTATGGMCLPDPNPGATFHQIEHLARPGINEVFLFSNAFMEGYNATAPTFTGVDATTLGLVVGEVQTVMKALYLGACLVNGALSLSETTGVHPAGATCNAVGGALFDGTGALTQASKDAAQLYANRVTAQFVPDVMRIDVGVANARPTSTYETLCGNPADSKPLLCGGRHLRDDVIDITYDYLLNGAGSCGAGFCGASSGLASQVNSLVSDGVVFDTTPNLSVTLATETGTTATYTAAAHGFAVGDLVAVNGYTGAGNTGYNGNLKITAVTTNTFSGTRAAGLNATATTIGGTIVSTNISSRSASPVAADNNKQQGHPNVTKTFPYSAAPF